MKKGQSPAAQRFFEHLQRARELRLEVAAGDKLPRQHHALSAWQTARLAATYADLAAQKRYRAAMEFFLSDLYGTKDFAQRDDDIARAYPLMVRMLSENAMESMSLAVELHALTQELDHELIRVLHESHIDIGAHPEALDQELYAQAYRECDKYDSRLRQIELIQQTGGLLEEVVRHRVIYASIRLARGPAHAAGYGELQSFIERGLRAFKQMKGATKFLKTIYERELFILDQIYSGRPLTDWSAEGFRD
ncbi:MAG: hypothetical protein OEQ74_01980 [Gammaproteobacteria bacterium]|nr:hypothetical protein [Gammaproteobacteria bacterium]